MQHPHGGEAALPRPGGCRRIQPFPLSFSGEGAVLKKGLLECRPPPPKRNPDSSTRKPLRGRVLPAGRVGGLSGAASGAWACGLLLPWRLPVAPGGRDSSLPESGGPEGGGTQSPARAFGSLTCCSSPGCCCCCCCCCCCRLCRAAALPPSGSSDGAGSRSHSLSSTHLGGGNSSSSVEPIGSAVAGAKARSAPGLGAAAGWGQAGKPSQAEKRREGLSRCSGNPKPPPRRACPERRHGLRRKAEGGRARGSSSKGSGWGGVAKERRWAPPQASRACRLWTLRLEFAPHEETPKGAAGPNQRGVEPLSVCRVPLCRNASWCFQMGSVDSRPLLAEWAQL